jgi:hypothetical protein
MNGNRFSSMLGILWGRRGVELGTRIMGREAGVKLSDAIG